MSLQEIITELEAIKAELVNPKAQHYSHYTIEGRHKEIVEKFAEASKNSSSLEEEVNRCKLLNIEISAELKKLEAANAKMISELDFDKACQQLIDAGDLVNLKGLINIGEYFGVKSQGGREVSGALDYVLKDYQLSANKRTAKNKPCLDYLCHLLRHPILKVPTTGQTSSTLPSFLSGYTGNSTIFKNSQDKVKDILRRDETIELMMWIADASFEDRHFALRAVCSQEGSFDCLGFMLFTGVTRLNIDILVQGKPSLQCAMHRAIQSGSAVIISTMLSSDINKSNDVLRQLLVQDKNGLTPIDFLSKIKDSPEYGLIVRTIRCALEEHQRDSRLALSVDEAKIVYDKLNQFLPAKPANVRRFN